MECNQNRYEHFFYICVDKMKWAIKNDPCIQDKTAVRARIQLKLQQQQKKGLSGSCYMGESDHIFIFRVPESCLNDNI